MKKLSKYTKIEIVIVVLVFITLGIGVWSIVRSKPQTTQPSSATHASPLGVGVSIIAPSEPKDLYDTQASSADNEDTIPPEPIKEVADPGFTYIMPSNFTEANIVGCGWGDSDLPDNPNSKHFVTKDYKIQDAEHTTNIQTGACIDVTKSDEVIDVEKQAQLWKSDPNELLGTYIYDESIKTVTNSNNIKILRYVQGHWSNYYIAVVSNNKGSLVLSYSEQHDPKKVAGEFNRKDLYNDFEALLDSIIVDQ